MVGEDEGSIGFGKSGKDGGVRGTRTRGNAAEDIFQKVHNAVEIGIRVGGGVRIARTAEVRGLPLGERKGGARDVERVGFGGGSVLTLNQRIGTGAVRLILEIPTFRIGQHDQRRDGISEVAATIARLGDVVRHLPE